MYFYNIRENTKKNIEIDLIISHCENKNGVLIKYSTQNKDKTKRIRTEGTNGK